MVKHTQTILRQQPTNCLSVFDHFVGLALKGLKGYPINPFHDTSHFLYPLETSESLWSYNIFSEYRERPVK